MEEERFRETEITEEEIRPRKKRRFWIWLLVIGLVIFGIGAALAYKTGFTFSQISVGHNAGVLPLSDNIQTPSPDPDRLNILLLGLRGEGDPNGGLLTDSIMLISIQKPTGKVALISIPRDLYVTMPGETYKEKINYAYAFGFEKKGAAGALFMSKTIVSRITGLYIDYTVSVNHNAFKEIIDTLGGIDVYLDKAFVEDQQWTNGGDAGPSWAFSIQRETVKTQTSSSTAATSTIEKWVFKIPAGTSHFDGNTALYYTRARYSTSDFDRVVRQQQVLLAMKDKALTLGILANPVKLFQIMDSLGKNIKMDLTMDDARSLLSFYPKINTKNIIHKVFNTTPEGLLYTSKSSDGAYILLPVGDNFDKIKETCKNIFN